MMRRVFNLLVLFALLVITSGANACVPSQAEKEAEAVNRQQGQYAIGQPVPVFDFSLGTLRTPASQRAIKLH